MIRNSFQYNKIKCKTSNNYGLDMQSRVNKALICIMCVYIELSKAKAKSIQARNAVSKSLTQENLLVVQHAITVLVKLTCVIFFFLPQACASTPSCFKL